MFPQSDEENQNLKRSTTRNHIRRLIRSVIHFEVGEQGEGTNTFYKTSEPRLMFSAFFLSLPGHIVQSVW